MSAAVQCLSQLRDLSQYFVGGKYVEKINVSDTNFNGSKGEITCAFG